ncbi:DUF3263 domain-containing protein [Rhodococcus sp. WS4]|nr:DUF3263 domain-containing protein [Rhodococcus sp. WS4]
MEVDTRVDDVEMIDFVRSWHLYGGGSDEEIFIAFGLKARTFFQRVLMLLTAGRTEELSPATVEAMRKVCRARLWLDRGGTRQI